MHFRVWAPRWERIEVLIEPQPGADKGISFSLEPEGNGYHSGLCVQAASGTEYWYKLPDGGTFPDPASRFQPNGPHGYSQVIDPAFQWSNDWKGVSIEGQVVYEMHVGTFTQEGNWATAAQKLSALASLGITVIEVMPVAEFPGRFGWGYDGVNLFAPTRLYGTPDDFRRFVDQAHAAGLAVILDVVYNHLGPEGNHLEQYSDFYFTDRYPNEWGKALNFDGPGSGPVREFFIANARYWIEEFHLDGLRLDATQQMFDCSPEHILAAMASVVRHAAEPRTALIVAENEPQHIRLIETPERGGFGLDALWNDDFHHTAMVVLTGRNEAYYSDYKGSPQEFVSAAKWGYLYQGQRYRWQQKRRGAPTFRVKPAAFISYIQNHDQIANTLRGRRCHELTSPGNYRAMTSLWLLMPQTPMLFQGQEFAASTPFLYFTDLGESIAKSVRTGRAQFLAQFPNIARPEIRSQLPDPCDPLTFTRSKLDWTECDRHAEEHALHRDLLKLRRDDPAFRVQSRDHLDGAVLGSESFALRFFPEDPADHRILLVNFGVTLQLDPAPEPLLAPPPGMRWEILWSSEDAKYGGSGTPEPETKDGWLIPGCATIVLRPVEDPDNP